jgi:putative tributyrin esterase
MAFLQCNFKSETLNICTAVNVILPERPMADVQKNGPDGYRYPVLYLLHGYSDDQTIWQRRTSIERYAEPLGLAVIMPAVNHSWYTDMAEGTKYWTFVSQELPARMASLFPLSSAREDTFVAGLSMGGYGSFKLALSQPERFAAAASFSGAVSIVDLVGPDADRNPDPAWKRELCTVFGDLAAVAGSANDLVYLAERAAKSGQPVPRLFQWCGTEDFLYADNLKFRDHARAVGLDLAYSEGPGDHTWGYWDTQIQRFLEWMPLRRRAPFLPAEG